MAISTALGYLSKSVLQGVEDLSHTHKSYRNRFGPSPAKSLAGDWTRPRPSRETGTAVRRPPQSLRN